MKVMRSSRVQGRGNNDTCSRERIRELVLREACFVFETDDISDVALVSLFNKC